MSHQFGGPEIILLFTVMCTHTHTLYTQYQRHHHTQEFSDLHYVSRVAAYKKHDINRKWKENAAFQLPCFLSFTSSSVGLPTLWVMELSRQLCGKMRRSTRRAPLSSSTTSSLRGLEIHFYLHDMHQLEYFKDCYTAEELCVEAAKKCCESLTCCLVGNNRNKF